MKQFILSLVLLSTVFTSYSQVDFVPNSSFKVEVGLPNNSSNQAFRDLMQGLVILTPSYQHTFNNSFSIGAGLRYGFFNVNEFKNNVDLSGGMHIAGAFVKIGREKFYGDIGIDYGVRIGYSANFFNTNYNDSLSGKPFSNESIFIEPTFGISLMATERTSFRLALGFAVNDFVFSADQVGIEQFSAYDINDLNKRTSYFTIGFGYSYYFGVK
ncbi:hypothetical protein [Brumimicrobium mesophilum]|uniref:hypothetical protein n=1 Tax=Brumimicrobium mesophilum TaxID=392717 RepID=UPI00131CD833|nr:hypothetical protein [Brumimicrobium mesophilum]